RPVFGKPGKQPGRRKPVNDRWNVCGIDIASKDVALCKCQALGPIPDDIGIFLARYRDEGRDALLNIRKLVPIAIVDGNAQRPTSGKRVLGDGFRGKYAAGPEYWSLQFVRLFRPSIDYLLVL